MPILKGIIAVPSPEHRVRGVKIVDGSTSLPFMEHISKMTIEKPSKSRTIINLRDAVQYRSNAVIMAGKGKTSFPIVQR